MNFDNKVIFIKKMYAKNTSLTLGKMYQIIEYYPNPNYYLVTDDDNKKSLYNCSGFLTLAEAINETLKNDNSK